MRLEAAERQLLGLVGAGVVLTAALAAARPWLARMAHSTLSIAATPAPLAAARVGAAAPTFQLQTLGGRLVSLRQLEAGGHPVLLTFFNLNVPACGREVAVLNRIAARYGRAVRVVGIDVEQDPLNVRREARQAGIRYPILLDQPGYVAKAYGVQGFPASALIGPGGTLEAFHPGPFLSVRAAWPLLRRALGG
ncbi:putative TlpA family protein disulfide reductase [Candidatus Hydrogenisulfobacillus filiaventi]|uniref:Putative TlpA family protein disulfide reductase n=1 Tax=Candidatus Hydrogenisulfobacillus filiaventi TaxID=2707344 RepID=A0A6F8ZHK3_9FIRM|nr:putative TlpA family protein disulfide reductase [Candidatus Hydrogenisulfobacillus filiaventi]